MKFNFELLGIDMYNKDKITFCRELHNFIHKRITKNKYPYGFIFENNKTYYFQVLTENNRLVTKFKFKFRSSLCTRYMISERNKVEHIFIRWEKLKNYNKISDRNFNRMYIYITEEPVTKKINISDIMEIYNNIMNYIIYKIL